MTAPSTEPAPARAPEAEPAPGEPRAERREDQPADASALGTVLLRDLTFGVAALSIWAGAEAWSRQSGLGLAALLSVLGGFVVGGLVTALLHEWGHFVGARLSGAVAPIAPAKNLVPLFLFDMDRSGDAPFRAMSVGGSVGHWSAAFGLFYLLPGSTAGEVAIQAASFGFAVFASVVEVPVLRLAFAGVPPGKALGTITQERLRRGVQVGFATALVLFVVL